MCLGYAQFDLALPSILLCISDLYKMAWYTLCLFVVGVFFSSGCLEILCMGGYFSFCMETLAPIQSYSVPGCVCLLQHVMHLLGKFRRLMYILSCFIESSSWGICAIQLEVLFNFDLQNALYSFYGFIISSLMAHYCFNTRLFFNYLV